MKRTNLSIFGLSAAFLLVTVRGVAETNADPTDKSLWITSIARVGESDTFIASTANGLLMQPASVESFPIGNIESKRTLYTHPAAVWAVTCTADGKTVASVDYRGNLATYDTASEKMTLHENALERWCQALITEPTSQSVVAGNEAGKISVWSFAEAKITRSVELEGHAVTGLAISPDQQQLAASDGNGNIHFLKWPSLEIISKSKVSDSPAWCVAYSPSSGKLFVGCGDNRIYEMGTQPEAKPEVLATGKDWITKITISKSGTIAAGEVSGGLHVLANAESSSEVSKTFNAKSGVWSLLWSGEETLLVGTRKDGISRVGRSWDWITEPKRSQEESEKTDEQAEAGTEETTPEPATPEPEVKEEAKAAEKSKPGENPDTNQ